ncbi:MAG TPA: glycosyltransferase [Flavobacterium sp.]|nr:glycosyltransferase [Flavobacterium sp.]
MYFSLIIPVYNRPDEIDELLSSLTRQDYREKLEVVIIEDGSTVPCRDVVLRYENLLYITYYNKPNSGPGSSRNFGMNKGRGDYFLIFDSDCILPQEYLTEVHKNLTLNYVDCFGGPDKALDSFSDIQKAINFAMTSFLTTGGIRGGSETIGKFQPRSFNMGISRTAFDASKGFSHIHPGEDPDLSIRLWKLGFETKLYGSAYVYHKRRIDWRKFYIQVTKFGKARPILNRWYPEYQKLTFFFPTIFIIGLAVAIIAALFSSLILLYLYVIYFMTVFVVAAAKSNLKVGLLAVAAVAIQFYGYGTGFLKSFVTIQVFDNDPEKVFPELFFKQHD